MPKALKTVTNAKAVKVAKSAKSARRVVKPWTKEDVRALKAHPHARHQGIEGDEAHSWRSPAASWYPRPRTRPPPVRFSVFQVISAPLPYRRTCPWRPSGLAQDAKWQCCADRERPRCFSPRYPQGLASRGCRGRRNTNRARHCDVDPLPCIARSA